MGGRLFDGDILHKTDSLDNEEEQLKKACAFGFKRGAFPNTFRDNPRGVAPSLLL